MPEPRSVALPTWFVRLAGAVLCVIGATVLPAVGWAVSINERLARIEERIDAKTDQTAEISRRLDRIEQDIRELQRRQWGRPSSVASPE
jgi:septal ring factor EnvC (AmiA/AmiB activator)